MFLRSAQKHEAHGSSKQSDQTMAQPEVAPNVTTGITQVMLIRKVVGPLVVHPLKIQRVHHPYKFMCPAKQCWHKTWIKTVYIPRSSRRHNIRTHLAMRLIDRSKERLHWMKTNGTKPFFIALKNATQRKESGVPAGDTGVLSGNKNDFHNDFIR